MRHPDAGAGGALPHVAHRWAVPHSGRAGRGLAVSGVPGVSPAAPRLWGLFGAGLGAELPGGGTADSHRTAGTNRDLPDPRRRGAGVRQAHHGGAQSQPQLGADLAGRLPDLHGADSDAVLQRPDPGGAGWRGRTGDGRFRRPPNRGNDARYAGNRGIFHLL